MPMARILATRSASAGSVSSAGAAMKTVTRTELAEVAYRTGGVTRNDARSLVDQCLETITDALVAGDGVLISGFGSFNIRHKRARIGQNPRRPNEKHVITARGAVVFRASRKAGNGGKSV